MEIFSVDRIAFPVDYDWNMTFRMDIVPGTGKC